MLQSEKTKQAEVQVRLGEILSGKECAPDFCFDRAKETLIAMPWATGRIADIGAGRCERGLALAHNLGVAVDSYDISGAMLDCADQVSKRVFDKPIPKNFNRIAGDFMETTNGGYDGIMTWATLHHFPDPVPFFEKVYTMLRPGGWFFFSREPLKSWLGLHELKQMYLCYKVGNGLLGLYRERELGILETSFNLDKWIEAFEVFDDYDVQTLYPLKLNPVKQKTLARIFGGRLQGKLWKR